MRGTLGDIDPLDKVRFKRTTSGVSLMLPGKGSTKQKGLGLRGV